MEQGQHRRSSSFWISLALSLCVTACAARLEGDVAADASRGDARADAAAHDAASFGDASNGVDADATCEALEDEQNPAHDVLSACANAYPSASVPRCDALSQWVPAAADCLFANVASNVADEFVDSNTGGISMPKVQAGRDHARALAFADFAIDEVDILHEQTLPIELDGELGCNPGGMALAWGSFLHRTPAGAVGEVVYGYVGVCESDGDCEAFLRSREPIEVCGEGTVVD